MIYVRITEALLDAAVVVAKGAVALHVRALDRQHNRTIKVMDRKLDRLIAVNQAAANAQREYRQAMDAVSTGAELRNLRAAEAKARVL